MAIDASGDEPTSGSYVETFWLGGNQRGRNLLQKEDTTSSCFILKNVRVITMIFSEDASVLNTDSLHMTQILPVALLHRVAFKDCDLADNMQPLAGRLFIATYEVSV